MDDRWLNEYKTLVELYLQEKSEVVLLVEQVSYSSLYVTYSIWRDSSRTGIEFNM
jgi:hypothetical protein